MGPISGANLYAAMQAQVDRAAGMAGGVGGADMGGDLARMGAMGGAGAVQGPGFGELLQQVMTEAVGQSRAAEAAMSAQVQGKAELVEVVTAIAAAETSLETMMAVRDQVIAAYQEIMRMPI